MCFVRGSACPTHRMDAAVTGMPKVSAGQPIPIVALALAQGHPVIPGKAGIHLALRVGWGEERTPTGLRLRGDVGFRSSTQPTFCL